MESGRRNPVDEELSELCELIRVGAGALFCSRDLSAHIKANPFEMGRHNGIGLGFNTGLSLNRGRGGLFDEQIGWPPGRQQQRSANETTKAVQSELSYLQTSTF